ncbi:MAG: phage portal protein [Pseudomonadota bacterium]
MLSRIGGALRRATAPTPQRRSFDAAAGGRRGSSFGRHFGSHNAAAMHAGATVRDRARRAYANNGYVRNGVDAFVAEAVGAGIAASSAHPEADLREDIDARFAQVAEAIDAEGRTNFAGLQRAVVRTVFVDGEAFVMIEETDDGLQLRQIPTEFLDDADTRDLRDGGYVVGGIEFDRFGRRVAYHIRPQRPTDVFPGAREAIRVSAANVLHICEPLGPGQVRGVSALAPILLTLNELDQLQDALLVGAKVAAMHAAFLVDMTGQSGDPYGGDQDGDVLETGIEPGAMLRLPAGLDVKFNSPDQAKDGVAFAKFTLGQVAAGLGVPQHLVDGDLTGANYSSLRAGLLPFRAKVEQFTTGTLVPQFLAPAFRRAIREEYFAGRLELPGFERDPAPFLRAEWLRPRPMQVDPAKDAEALREMLALGLVSRRQAVRQLGSDVVDIDREIAADRAREEALGLTFNDPKEGAA